MLTIIYWLKYYTLKQPMEMDGNCDEYLNWIKPSLCC